MINQNKMSSRFIRNGKTISGRLHDEMVMMDLEQGKYFSLNPIATRIWDLMENKLTAEELCALLTEEYEVESKRCIEEVREYLTEMLRLRLITEVSG